MDDIFEGIRHFDQHQMAGIRIKHYHFRCSKHFIFSPIYPQSFRGSDSSIELMLQEMEHSLFIGCSSLVISIKVDCDCLTDILQRVCIALRNNEENLKYKTKFIIQHNKFMKEISHADEYQPASDEAFDKYYSKENESRLKEAKNDLRYFLKSDLKNAIFLQCNLTDLFVWHINKYIFYEGIKPLQAMKSGSVDGIISYTTNVELYFYNINPTLNIIFNNKYFTNLPNREGSEIDVQRLCKYLDINNMPYMLMQDLSRDRLLQLIHHLELADFSVFEAISIIMMTHGDSNGILYADDGSEIDIKKNIILPIQSNTSLRDALKLFIFVACRGKTDPDVLDDEDLEMIEDNPTDNSYLQSNTLVLYSIKESLTSLRYANDGTPFIKQYCEHVLRKSEHNDAITKLAADINNELRKVTFFCNLKNIIDCVTGSEQSGRTKEVTSYNGAKVIRQNVNVLRLLEDLPVLNNLQLQYNDSHGIYKNSSCQEQERFEKMYRDRYKEFLENIKKKKCKL